MINININQMSNQGDDHININININKEENNLQELPSIQNNNPVNNTNHIQNQTGVKRKPSAKVSNIGSHTKKAVDIYQQASMGNKEEIKKKQPKKKDTSRAKIDQSNEFEAKVFNFSEQAIQNHEQNTIGESIEFKND